MVYSRYMYAGRGLIAIDAGGRGRPPGATTPAAGRVVPSWRGVVLGLGKHRGVGEKVGVGK